MKSTDLKIKCLELAVSCSNRSITMSADSVATMQMKSTLVVAQEFYQWITEEPKVEKQEPVSND